MNKKIKIRLELDPEEKDDQLHYNMFTEIKKNLSIHHNTEVIRYCIKKSYDYINLENNFKRYIKNELVKKENNK